MDRKYFSNDDVNNLSNVVGPGVGTNDRPFDSMSRSSMVSFIDVRLLMPAFLT
jgi:hypothetical protein